jgi:tetratricopeptide (TPR) repeat protein
MKARRMLLLALALHGWVPAPHAQLLPGEPPPSPIPRGTLDPKAPVRPLDEALREVEVDRLAAPALERYHAGDYAAAAKLGLEILEKTPAHHGLRYAVANSFAWTGRYDDAAAQYPQLFGTPYDSRARVGLGNVLRWRAQAHLAEPYYVEALAADPANKDAAEGLALARRELRPAVIARVSRTDDSELRRDEASLSYRHWTGKRGLRLEAGVLAGRTRSELGRWSPVGVFASAWAPGIRFAPQVEAAYYDSDVGRARAFGTLQVEPVRDRLKLRAGRVDWGRTAFSAGAIADELTARLAGVAGETSGRLGVLRYRLDLYDVSDENDVVDGDVNITPHWQPLPGRLIWSGGLYARNADREDPRYWSPRPAYLLAYIGLQRHWSFSRGDLSASLRRGAGLTRSAGDSWSGGIAGRTWLRQDLALGIEAWAVDAPRPGRYRVHHVGAFVQQLL